MKSFPLSLFVMSWWHWLPLPPVIKTARSPLSSVIGWFVHRWKMIRMSLDKETVLPHEVSPAFPTAVSLSEQPQLVKTHPLRPKNGLHRPGNSQPPISTSALPSQRIGKRRYSMGVGLKGLAKRHRRANSDSQSEHVLPSHFLLGGNIFDPLNLNSLLDEDVNKWDTKFFFNVKICFYCQTLKNTEYLNC